MKYGDKVTVIKDGFFKGAKGILIDTCDFDLRYDVRLDVSGKVMRLSNKEIRVSKKGRKK